ncbi:hypothetical protein HYU15_03625, partial [Candidatus Woesearchaeota archaeon]|nr:hypothetical protein [Candidatus Woesearchaeota archaeon]
MPENLIDDLEAGKAVKFLGEKGFADILLKGTTQNVIDLNKVDAEKFMQYVKGVRKLGVNDPLANIGEHQLLKMYKASSVTTKVGGQTIDGVAVLKKGYHDFAKDQGFGWEHIKAGQHDIHIRDAFKLPDTDASVKQLIGEALEKGIKNPSNPFEIIYNVPGGKKSLRVKLRNAVDNLGSITTAYPDELYVP